MKNLTIGFIGLGLIGGSIAKAIRRVHPSYKIIAYNRSENSRILALNDGTLDIATDKIDDHFRECDYIFLCTPVEMNVHYLTILKDYIEEGTIITDVGSVKGNIHQAVRDLGMEVSFIGGHPMAGSEKTGYTNASDHLLENAFYILTPTTQTPNSAIHTMTALVSEIGALPLVLDEKEHDRTVAAISHLPHLIAATLVNLVKDSDSSAGTMKKIAAGGFKDITRIASSSPDMWEQICMTNSENISELINDYVASLLQVKNALDTHQEGEIYKLFTTSRDYRDSFDDHVAGPISQTYTIFCDLKDEYGAIATVATLLATHQISIKNIGINHNREHQEGVLLIEFYTEKAREDAISLLTLHQFHPKKS